MKMFKCSPDGYMVDLDDQTLYVNYPKTPKELDNRMFSSIGFALCYMNYFYKENFANKKPNKKDLSYYGWEQRQRVDKLIKDFTDNREYHYNDILWYQQQIFIFENEIENMC